MLFLGYTSTLVRCVSRPVCVSAAAGRRTIGQLHARVSSLIYLIFLCKGKGKSLDTGYSATYMSQTRDQQRFTISEVAADWHEPMVPQCIMWPSIACANR